MSNMVIETKGKGYLIARLRSWDGSDEANTPHEVFTRVCIPTDQRNVMHPRHISYITIDGADAGRSGCVSPSVSYYGELAKLVRFTDPAALHQARAAVAICEAGL